MAVTFTSMFSQGLLLRKTLVFYIKYVVARDKMRSADERLHYSDIL